MNKVSGLRYVLSKISNFAPFELQKRLYNRCLGHRLQIHFPFIAFMFENHLTLVGMQRLN